MPRAAAPRETKSRVVVENPPAATVEKPSFGEIAPAPRPTDVDRATARQTTARPGDDARRTAKRRSRRRARARTASRAERARATVENMYEPSVLCQSLQYSCDACGDLPILRRRWVCERCEDYDLCEQCHARQHKRQRERARGRPESGSSTTTTTTSEEDENGDFAHDATHEMRAFAVEDDMEPVTKGKLRDCVLNAASRWYVETLRNAKQGDANAAALAAQMLLVGYGCNADADEASYWQNVARSSGARRVEGVYDELP